ncbi:GSCFA family protein [Ulvibacter sp. MAR_2010_11]|uniref:GSCFA domain-containing protein n=1 Tax=Ulvibacter sp. MAR_2010_11 TaxID=1250229 RepID=UPI000C2B7F22|nr:GSCFA domain-containing protein [Ulvibacter sp. MAR_2010_11]PKA82418.1 GSCFA family protein [Ulvibacter sp. MAR_2010_11]
MKLQTQIPLQPEENPIDYSSKVVLLGSCFAENIGGKLDYFKFQNLQNPFGIIFHPLAIEGLVRRALEERFFAEDDIFFHNEQWHSFEVHSLVTASGKEDFLKLLNEKLKHFREYLLTATHIIFTYGTARVYRFTETNKLVANCHKLPQQHFTKELLSIELISESIQNTSRLLKTYNFKVQQIHTVSPVRHLKDGFVENTQSKAHLIAGLHTALKNDTRSNYFPSYEIVMDELRDYRFYGEDMLHPTATAVTYIWNRFKEVWIASETDSIQNQVDSIQKGLQHRPFNPSSKANEVFRIELQQKITALQKQFQHIQF